MAPSGAGKISGAKPAIAFGFPPVKSRIAQPDVIRHPNQQKANAAFSGEREVSWRSRLKGSNRKGNDMKKTILSIALALAAPFAWAQTSTTSTTTTTTTDGGGTITEYTPGSVITLKESSGPRRYKFGKKVVYVTKSGRELDETTVKTRIKLGIPVHVHYTTEGDDMLVDRVILDED
jgi:hypothetical protein